ncbi:MAG: alpha-mannosidase [Eubacteriales bacterium]|nr:alpha-mannosidase [Eubacteriales bacterium]
MFLKDRKLDRRVTELKNYRYRDIMKIESFAACEDEERLVNPQVPVDYTDWREMKAGEYWSGRDRYLWLHTDIHIPETFRGKRAVGCFDFGKTGAGNNSGFEAMCYIDQAPYQGVDSNHQEVFFKEEDCGRDVSLTFRLWSGLEGGGVPRDQEHRINEAQLAWLDEKVDDIYYLGTVILETISVLEDGSPEKYKLREALDEACHCIDWSYPGSGEFYESVHQADDILNERIDAMDKNTLVNVRCVGHTHIDMAWLWRLKHTHEKASRSFSTVLRMMELFPEYIFLQTQPQIYAYIKEDFPEIYQAIKEKVKEGRWETDGAMWVEADCNLTSGESLTRQILLGSKFIKDEFDKDIHYLWLPDVFGYSWALPQILRKSGIDMFMTTKISWNQYNRMPHDTFRWKGMDGSEVLTHFITTPEPWNEPGSWFYTYNGLLTAKTVKGVWDAYSEKEINQDLLISYGYGDGGGGVNRDLLERRRRIDKMPGLPSLKTSKASEYFDDLKETVKNTSNYVHTWDGELYLEYHRGTYTSQAYNKRMNRKMELLYRRAEWLTAMEGVLSGNMKNAKQDKLREGWHLILTNQFHDIIPGSSIHDVYEDCHKDYGIIESIADCVERESLSSLLSEKEDSYTVWNASGWEISELAAVPETRKGVFTDEQGNVLESQRSDGLTYVALDKIPAMGCAVVHFQPEEAAAKAGVSVQAPQTASSFMVSGREVETPFYSITLNQYGQITKLYDKTFSRDVLPKGEKANVLQMFEDKPIDNDAWDIDIFYQEKMREITELTEFDVTECGALRLVIHMEWIYMNSRIAQDMILYRDDRRIDFKTYVDYHERQQLLKAAFPVDIRSTYGTYDIQYGNVRRPNHWNTSWDQARFESVAHRFADLSERNYGVSLLNDCKYGHDIKDNVIRISLIRAGLQPDHLQDQGEHFFTYSLLPHGGDFVEGNTVQSAYQLNNPVKVVKGASALPYKNFFTLDNPFVEVDAVKKAEDSNALVIRFHEYAGSRQKVTLTPGFAYTDWAESDLRERAIEGFKRQPVELELHPYEIKTILLNI